MTTFRLLENGRKVFRGYLVFFGHELDKIRGGYPIYKSIPGLASSLWHSLEQKDKFSPLDNFKFGNTTKMRQIRVGTEDRGGDMRRELASLVTICWPMSMREEFLRKNSSEEVEEFI